MENKGMAAQATAPQVEAPQDVLYIRTLAEIRKIIPANKFEAKENKSGITWFGEGKTRLMKMVETKKGLRIEFNVPVQKVEGLTILSEEEAKEKHMGTCRWIYTGDNIDTVKTLVQSALKDFAPKQRADAKVEKDKKDEKAPKAAASEKSGTVTSRQLTDEERAKLMGQKSDQQKEAEHVAKLQGKAN